MSHLHNGSSNQNLIIVRPHSMIFKNIDWFLVDRINKDSIRIYLLDELYHTESSFCLVNNNNLEGSRNYEVYGFQSKQNYTGQILKPNLENYSYDTLSVVAKLEGEYNSTIDLVPNVIKKSQLSFIDAKIKNDIVCISNGQVYKNNIKGSTLEYGINEFTLTDYPDGPKGQVMVIQDDSLWLDYTGFPERMECFRNKTILFKVWNGNNLENNPNYKINCQSKYFKIVSQNHVATGIEVTLHSIKPSTTIIDCWFNVIDSNSDIILPILPLKVQTISSNADIPPDYPKISVTTTGIESIGSLACIELHPKYNLYGPFVIDIINLNSNKKIDNIVYNVNNERNIKVAVPILPQGKYILKPDWVGSNILGNIHDCSVMYNVYSLNKIRSEMDELHRDINRKNQSISSLEEENVTLKEHHKEIMLQNNLKVKSNESKLESSITELRNKNAVLEEMTKNNESIASVLKSSNAKLEEEVNILRADISQWNRKENNLRFELSSKNKQISNMEVQLNAQKNLAESNNIKCTDYQLELENIDKVHKEQLDKVKDESSKLKSELLDNHEQVRKLTQSLEIQQAELEATKMSINAIIESSTEKDNEIYLLKSEKADLQQNIEEIALENTKLKGAVENISVDPIEIFNLRELVENQRVELEDYRKNSILKNSAEYRNIQLNIMSKLDL
jgi:hypothetical protein